MGAAEVGAVYPQEQQGPRAQRGHRGVGGALGANTEAMLGDLCMKQLPTHSSALGMEHPGAGHWLLRHQQRSTLLKNKTKQNKTKNKK